MTDALRAKGRKFDAARCARYEAALREIRAYGPLGTFTDADGRVLCFLWQVKALQEMADDALKENK